jgi:hypothetical protein
MKDASSKSKNKIKAKKDDSNIMATKAAKAAFSKAQKVWNETEMKFEVLGAQIFQLYANLLSDKSDQPWNKIINAQIETAPLVDLKGKLQETQGKKMWESFLSFSPSIC